MLLACLLALFVCVLGDRDDNYQLRLIVYPGWSTAAQGILLLVLMRAVCLAA